MAVESNRTRQPTKKVYTPPQLIPLDPTTALKRLREAAENGDAQAKLMLKEVAERSNS